MEPAVLTDYELIRAYNDNAAINPEHLRRLRMVEQAILAKQEEQYAGVDVDHEIIYD